jgi:hypothetical protein
MAKTEEFKEKGIEGNSIKGAIKGFNDDGTVSFKDSAGSDIVANRSICKNFGYRWDNPTQTCKWRKRQENQFKKEMNIFKSLTTKIIGSVNKMFGTLLKNVLIVGDDNEIYGNNENGVFIGTENYIGDNTNNCSILGGGQHEIGRRVNVTDEHTIDTRYSSVLGGRGALVKRFGEQVLCAGGRDNSNKGLQTSQFILTGSTTDNTATELFICGEYTTALATAVTEIEGDTEMGSDADEEASDGFTGASSTNAYRIDFKNDNFLATFTADFMAYQTGGSSGSVGDSHTKRVQGTIRKVGGTTDLVGSVTNSLAKSDGLAITFSATADDTNDSLKIQVTGQNNKNVTYVVAVKLNQIRIPV